MGRSVAEKRKQKPAAHKSFARIAVDDEVSLRVPSASKYKKAAKISKSAPVCPAVRAQIGCASRSRDRSCAQASAARPISREMPGHLKPNRSSSKANLKATKQLAPEPEEDVRTVYCLPASLKRRRFSRVQCSGVVKSLRFDPFYISRATRYCYSQDEDEFDEDMGDDDTEVDDVGSGRRLIALATPLCRMSPSLPQLATRSLPAIRQAMTRTMNSAAARTRTTNSAAITTMKKGTMKKGTMKKTMMGRSEAKRSSSSRPKRCVRRANFR